MHRPRHRRKDPKRTGPIRNAGEAWRERVPPEDPWASEGDDPASYGVRVGSSVIDEQIRRGRRMAQDLHREPRENDPRRGRSRPSSWYEDEEPPYRYGYGREPWPASRGGRGLFGMPLRHLERLLREVLNQIVSVRPNPWRLAELLLRLQIEAFSELARLGFGALGMAGMAGPRWGDSYDEDVDRVTRDIDEGYEYDEEDEEDEEEEPWTDEPPGWPAAPSVPTVMRSTVPIPVHVWSHERTEIDLDLPAGSQSLDLEIEPPLAAGTEPPQPAFEAELVAVAGGPTILRVNVPRDLPAGRYLRRVLIEATGEPAGTLTVQVGTVPPKASPKARKKK